MTDSLDAGTSADTGIADELESLARLLTAAGQGDVREHVSALQALAAAAETLAGRLEAGPAADSGKVDDLRR